MISIRFGIRLSWPITNAATFVTRIKPEHFTKAQDAVATLRLILPADIAGRLILEER